MHLQEELEGKERKRLKHKEKKEISVALEEECEKWTKEILNDDAFAEISTSWEVRSFLLAEPFQQYVSFHHG